MYFDLESNWYFQQTHEIHGMTVCNNIIHGTYTVTRGKVRPFN